MEIGGIGMGIGSSIGCLERSGQDGVGWFLCKMGVSGASVHLRGCEHEKGIRWMPWHQEAMKDVARCEKPWGAASRR